MTLREVRMAKCRLEILMIFVLEILKLEKSHKFCENFFLSLIWTWNDSNINAFELVQEISSLSHHMGVSTGHMSLKLENTTKLWVWFFILQKSVECKEKIICINRHYKPFFRKEQIFYTDDISLKKKKIKSLLNNKFHVLSLFLFFFYKNGN